MLNINKVMLTGRLTRDPETKYLPSGQAVTSLSIAVNRSYKDKSGEWRDDTSFIDIETWGQLAERCAETMRKGQPIYVEGRLKQDTWERDGVKQSKIRVSADTAKAFDTGQRAAAGGGQGDDYEGGSSNQYSGGGSSSGPAPASRPQQRPQQSGMPSDGLEFDGGTHDDIPF